MILIRLFLLSVLFLVLFVVRGILEVFDRNGLYSDNGMVAVSGGPPHGLTLDDDKFAALQSGEIPAEEALRSGLAEFYLDVQFDWGVCIKSIGLRRSLAIALFGLWLYVALQGDYRLAVALTVAIVLIEIGR